MHFDQKSEQFLQPILSSSNNNLSKKPLPWEELGRVGVIKAWSEEVRSALTDDYDSNHWQLVGHNYNSVSEDMIDEGRSQVAADAVANYISYNLYLNGKKLY